MPSLIDLTGKRFGRLVVIRDSGVRKSGSVYWECQCDCGNVTIVNSRSLRKNGQQSCGCYRGAGNTKHGMAGTRLYRIWSSMRTRCENKSSNGYDIYGGAGIKVCEQWKEFSSFSEWALSNGYAEDLTIDRIDCKKGYSPDNCRWVDRYEQANNRRNCLVFEKDGKKQTLAQWCAELELDYRLVINRIQRLGWPFERAISEPLHEEKLNMKAREKRKQVKHG